MVCRSLIAVCVVLPVSVSAQPWNIGTEQQLLLRAYHNLTAHYNAFWAARKKLEQVIEDYRNAHKQLLPVDTLAYPFIVPTGGAISAEHARTLKDAAQKATLCVKLHPHSKWTDDCYLLLGLARWWEGNTTAAHHTLSYLVSEYAPAPPPPPSNLKKLSFWRRLASRTFLWAYRMGLTHPFAYFDGVAALALYYAKQGDFPAAIDILNAGREHPLFPPHKQAEWHMLKAQVYAMSGSLTGAASEAQQALRLTRKKPTKIKYLYFLLQTYWRTGDCTNSAATAAALLEKGRLPIHIESYARLIKLLSEHQCGTLPPQQAISLLTELAHNKKHRAITAEALYRAGILAREANQQEYATSLLQEALATTEHRQQKKKILIALYETAIATGNFVLASKWIDTINALGESLPPKVQAHVQQVEQISTLTQQIAEIDTLLWLASLPEKQRIKEARLIITRKQQNQQQNQPSRPPAPFPGRPVVSPSSWYFYNPILVQQGQIMFREVWGNIPLTDMWRYTRALQQSIGSITDTLAPYAQDTNPTASAQLIVLLNKIPSSPTEIRAMKKELVSLCLELAQLLAKMNREDQAKQALQKAEIHLQDREDTLNFCTTANKATLHHPLCESLTSIPPPQHLPLDTIEQWYRNLLNALEKGETQQVLHLSETISLQELPAPIQARTLLIRALAYLRLGKTTEASTLLQQIIRTDEAEPEVKQVAKELLSTL